MSFLPQVSRLEWEMALAVAVELKSEVRSSWLRRTVGPCPNSGLGARSFGSCMDPKPINSHPSTLHPVFKISPIPETQNDALQSWAQSPNHVLCWCLYSKHVLSRNRMLATSKSSALLSADHFTYRSFVDFWYSIELSKPLP